MFKSISRSSIALFAFCLLIGPKLVSAQIAPGVLQSAAHTATITGTVTQSDGTPVAGADVKLTGPAVLTTKSDAHGTFAFTSVPWGSYQIVVTSTLGTASRSNVVVNGDSTVAIQYQPQSSLKEIARVSTRSAGTSINVSSSAVTSVSPSDYAFQGNGTWTQLFAQIPGVTTSGRPNQGNAAGATGFAAVAGAPQAPVVLTLNGALPYETSTTLDGMPLQNSSASNIAGGGVDLSNMPLNAFDTADIVRGPGANAPSIVDSIGGSFVLHAPGDISRNQYEFSISNDAYGGIVSNAKVALHLGRLSVTLIYGTNNSPGPLGNIAQMPATFTPVAIGGEAFWGPYHSTPNPSQGIENCNCSITTPLLACCVPNSTAWTEHSGAAAFSYKFTPSLTAEVFYAGTSSNQPYMYGKFPVEFAPGAGYSGSITPSPVGVPNYSFLDVGNFGQAPDNQSSSLLEEKVTAYIGHGVLRLAALQNNSYSDEGAYAFGPPSGTYTLWGTADLGGSYPGTPHVYNGQSENVTFNSCYTSGYYVWSNNRALLGSYAVQIGSSSSAGISYVTSYYNNADYASYFEPDGTLFYSYGQPPSVSETTNETRLHFDTEIGDRLSIGLSEYFANGSLHVPSAAAPNEYVTSNFPYSAPRLGVVWQASHDIAVRGSAGGGYALPTLQLVTGSPLYCVLDQCDEVLPNPNLKPEKTFGFDLGTDMRFHRNTVLSFDLYRTNLYGQFFQTNALVGTFNGLPLFSSGTANLANSVMEGINLEVHHDVSSGYYWRGTLGLTRGYVASVPAGFYDNPSLPCTRCVNQAIIPGQNFTVAAGELATVPYASASAQIGYRWNSGKYMDLVSTYYGNNNIYNVPGFVELDGHLGYALTKNVSLLATFRNITGVYDQAIQTLSPGYVVPVLPGAPANDILNCPAGAAFKIPYGPRSITLTANFKN